MSQVTLNTTEEDEEKFFLMYHLNFQPSEVDRLDQARRKWLIARFIAQKEQEEELMKSMEIRQKIQI